MTATDPDRSRRAEGAGLNALPAPRQVLLGGWLPRFADGCTRRADSVNPVWPGARRGRGDPDARIRACAALHAAQGPPYLFRVPSFLPPGLDAALDAHGSAPTEGETRVLLRPNPDADGPGGEGADAGGVEPAEGGPRAEWLDAQARIAGDGGQVARARRDMLAALAVPAAFGAVRSDGPHTPMASPAHVAVHDGLARFDGVASDPAARGRILSRRVLRALLGRARGAGAEGACLRVAAGNAAAVALYEGLGFRTEPYRHRCRRLDRCG